MRIDSATVLPTASKVSPLTLNSSVLSATDVETEMSEDLLCQQDVLPVVVDVASELLGSAVSAHDNLFRLGGNSMLAARLVAEVRKRVDVSIGLQDVLKAETFAALADRLVAKNCRALSVGDNCLSVEPNLSDIDNPGLTSFQRQRLRRDLLQLASTGRRTPYHIGSFYLLDGNLDQDLLEVAAQDLVQRHDALRMNFDLNAGAPRATTEYSDGQRVVTVIQRTFHDNAAALQACRDASLEPFDLANSLKIRITIAPMGGARSLMGIALEHLVCDLDSLNILVGDLALAYTARQRGSAPCWSTPAPSFQQWAFEDQTRTSGEGFARRLNHWRGVLDPLMPIPEMRFPSMREPIGISVRNAAQSTVNVMDTTAVALSERFKESAVTLFAGLSALLCVATSVATGQSVSSFVAPLQQREAGWEQCVGHFSHIVPVRAYVDRYKSVADLSRDIMFGVAEAASYDVDAELLLSSLTGAPFDRSKWLPWLYFDIANSTSSTLLKLDSVAVSEVDEEFDMNLRDGVTLIAAANGSGFRLWMQYEREVWQRQDADRFLNFYLQLIEGSIEHWNDPIGSWSQKGWSGF